MPISACKPNRSATAIISGDIQISSPQEAPSKKSAKEPRLETNPLLSKLRPRSSSVTAGAQSETSSSLRIKAAPFLTVPKSLDAYAIDSSVPYQFQPSKIAIIGGGLTGVISALKLRSLGHEVSLFESNEDICLEASKIPAHCYGAPGYCHLPKDEQIEIFRSGLAFAKLFPQAISLRPTIFALRKNDRVRVTNDQNGRFRTIDDLKNSVNLAENEYKKAVESDPKSEVFGPVGKYQSGYTHEQIQALRNQPLTGAPGNNDEWVANWAHEMSEEALSELQYPVFLVKEPEINMLRFRELARSALGELGVDTHIGETVNDLTSQAGKPGIMVNQAHFDYAVNCSGAESGTHDDKREAISERTVIVKGAGVASLPSPIDAMPQMYIMGAPMVHVSPFESGSAVINVTTPECTYVENGEARSKETRSQVELSEHMRSVMTSAGKGPHLYRTNNMISELGKLMPRMFGGAPEAFLGGHVCTVGSSDQRGTSITSVTDNALTIIAPKATSAVTLDLAGKISTASRFNVHLPLKQEGDLQIRMDRDVLADKAAAKARKMGLPVGMSRVLDRQPGQVKQSGRFASEFILPRGAEKMATGDVFDAAFRDRSGRMHVVIDGIAYGQDRRLGSGFGGEAFIYRDPATSHEIVVKEYFRLRSQASPGDMDVNPPKDAGKRAELAKIQMQDFMIEKSAFDALATHPAAKNIAHALRAGMVDGRFTIVMPYFRGGSVRDLCKNLDKAVEDGIISVGQRRDSALYIMRGILNGMKYLSSTLIHRDLKPDNVLLHIEKERDGTRVLIPKIADFGTSVLGTSSDLPVVTTPQYKSPEYLRAEQQGRGQHTAAQDVWSAGISLHELLTGHRPFDGDLPKDEHKIYDAIKNYAAGNTEILPADQSKAADLIRIMMNPSSDRATPAELLDHEAFHGINEKECQKTLSLIHQS
ncbi:FAD-dependent oxidoreductase [Ralstonia pseudosolanacearum]|uniref:FAD-dependent oxidoreductase n=1 Tax=Ralstonia pseudosolanacearum TaxID=1310165 RepID=UPI003AAE1E64